MRHIGSIQHDTDAEAFSDYLLAQGMPNMVEESAGGGDWAVWIEHDDHVDRAKAELESFRQNPADPRYHSAARTAGKLRVQEENKQRRLRKKFVDVRTTWGQPKQWNVPVTLTLMILCIVVSLATHLGRRMNPLGDWLRIESTAHLEQAIEDLDRAIQGATDDGEIDAEALDLRHLKERQRLPEVRRSGQVWRLVTPIFLHFSPLHLIFNLFWLRDLGGAIETRRGSWRFLGIVLLAAVLSNLAEYAWSGPFFGGMSGVVYALFGYVWIKGKYDRQSGFELSQETVWIMLAWLVLCMTGLVGSIANAAHLAGLIVGMAIAYFPVAKRRIRQKL